MNGDEDVVNATFIFGEASTFISVPMTAHSWDDGVWETLSEDPKVMVQAKVRQDEDPQWVVKDMFYKVQIWLKDGDIYMSTYFSREGIIENGFW